MNIVINKNMFKARKLAKGIIKKNKKFIFWMNIYGFGILITNTCKGLSYEPC